MYPARCRSIQLLSPALRLGDLEFEASLDYEERQRRKRRRERKHSVDVDSYFLNGSTMLRRKVGTGGRQPLIFKFHIPLSSSSNFGSNYDPCSEGLFFCLT